MNVTRSSLMHHNYSASPIIICRFILNLRKLTSGEDSSVSGNQSRSLRFVGNAGRSLQIGEEDENEDELEPGHEAVFTQPGAPSDISNETTYAAETNYGEEQSVHAQNAELEAQQVGVLPLPSQTVGYSVIVLVLIIH